MYGRTVAELSSAREARRNDDYRAAENHLAACWRLPGLGSSIGLEETLLGVQQGDLAEEGAWQKRAERDTADGLLILEALAKGSLATFRFNEARTYADAMLQRQPTSAQGMWLRGRAWARVQQEDKALVDLREAVRLEPAAREIRLSLADLLHKQGFVREAETHFELMRRDHLTDARLSLALAQCCEEDALLDDADELLAELLVRHSGHVAALIE